MYKLIHSTFTASDEIKKLKRKLEEKDMGDMYPIFKKAMDMCVDEFKNGVKIHRTGEGEEEGGGGGGEGSSEPIQKIIKNKVLLPPIIFESLYMGPNDPIEGKDNRFASVDFTLAWGRKQTRIYIPVMFNMKLVDIRGTIWVETNNHTHNNPHEEEKHQYYVRMQHTGLGSQNVTEGNLLGFDIYFDRWGENRGKLGLDIYEYPKEVSNTNPAELIAEIKKTGRTFKSTEVLLPSNMVDEYNGGAGIKIRTNLTILAVED